MITISCTYHYHKLDLASNGIQKPVYHLVIRKVKV
nr:MAG TPA: hypothetical protein [Caudoviricetes sp.]